MTRDQQPQAATRVPWRDLRARADSPWVVATVATFIMACTAMAAIITYDLGLSTLVVAGEEFVDVEDTPAELEIYPGIIGYDGQQYYRLSLDPFTSQAKDFGIPLDDPAYRQQRILFPAAAWAVSGVTGLSTLITLPLINLGAVFLLSFAVAGLAHSHARSAWWGLLAGVSPPIYYGVTRDLAEPVALALMIAGIVLWRRRPWAGAGLLSLAVLARETTLVAAAALGVVIGVTTLRQRRWSELLRLSPALVMPLVTYVLWQTWLSYNWEQTSLGGGGAERLGIPGIAVFRYLLDSPAVVTEGFNVFAVVWTVERVLLVVGLLCIALCLRRSTVAAELKVAWGLALVVAMAPGGGWAWPAQFTRAAAEVILLSITVAIGTRQVWGAVFRWILIVLIVLVNLLP